MNFKHVIPGTATDLWGNCSYSNTNITPLSTEENPSQRNRFNSSMAFPLGPGTETNPPVNDVKRSFFVSSCGHFMHYSCYANHMKHLRLAEMQVPTKPLSSANHEFVCPYCNTISNTLIPYVQTVSENSNTVKNDTLAFLKDSLHRSKNLLFDETPNSPSIQQQSSDLRNNILFNALVDTLSMLDFSRRPIPLPGSNELKELCQRKISDAPTVLSSSSTEKGQTASSWYVHTYSNQLTNLSNSFMPIAFGTRSFALSSKERQTLRSLFTALLFDLNNYSADELNTQFNSEIEIMQQALQQYQTSQNPPEGSKVSQIDLSTFVGSDPTSLLVLSLLAHFKQNDVVSFSTFSHIVSQILGVLPLIDGNSPPESQMSPWFNKTNALISSMTFLRRACFLTCILPVSDAEPHLTALHNQLHSLCSPVIPHETLPFSQFVQIIHDDFNGSSSSSPHESQQSTDDPILTLFKNQIDSIELYPSPTLQQLFEIFNFTSKTVHFTQNENLVAPSFLLIPHILS